MNRRDIEAMLKELRLKTGADRFFGKPEIRIAAAGDPFFHQFKTLIGPFHWTPDEVLKRCFPEAEAKSVVVWILPVRRNIRRAAGSQDGEIRIRMARTLTEAGYPSVVPQSELEKLRPAPCWDLKHFSTNWSERHAAFVAGAGTFGLSGSLITEHGTAVRLGSIVTALELPPDPRSYGDDPFAWCIRCGACARRCPVHALGEGRDKTACAEYVIHNPNRVCGLCQTGVPCEFRRPEKRIVENT